jgi:HEAT repeat protein
MTPFYRAAAADALGRINNSRATSVLIDTLTDLDNAVSVRNAAANALLRLSKYAPTEQVHAISETYPEVATRRLLMQVCR